MYLTDLVVLFPVNSMATPLSSYPSQQSPAHPNLGNDAQVHRDGYPKIAFFFSQCPRYLHLRRFSALAVRLLLYRQHELCVLEKNLLELEDRDAKSSDTTKRLFRQDFHYLREPNGGNEEQQRVYETLKRELKEYGKSQQASPPSARRKMGLLFLIEEAVLRFGQLGTSSYDTAQLRPIQWFLAQDTAGLSGLDSCIWGSLKKPHDHASDIIQVVRQPHASVMAKVFRNKILLWAPYIPSSLWLVLFWSRNDRMPIGSINSATGLSKLCLCFSETCLCHLSYTRRLPGCTSRQEKRLVLERSSSSPALSVSVVLCIGTISSFRC